MQIISNLAELDAKLAECDAALKESDDAMRQVFATFRMDFSTGLPPDPFSEDYRNVQMSLYERIAGKSYTPENEKTKFNVQAAMHRPFPYYTTSCTTAGSHLAAIGFLLQSLNVASGSRVIEFGAGWGNTTMALALVGL